MNEKLQAIHEMRDRWVSQRKRIMNGLENLKELIEETDGLFNELEKETEDQISAELEEMHRQRELEKKQHWEVA